LPLRHSRDGNANRDEFCAIEDALRRMNRRGSAPSDGTDGQSPY
jgi:hypothetical protein